MSAHLKEFAEYIVNTGRRPLAVDLFDDDWEPNGPKIRAEMEAAGLLEQSLGGLALTDKGESLADQK